ncbi:MAG TPA: hypothetical protein PKD09_10690 [Aggregatilinea sp.]|uniref:hypothetical protein n=1 Tax=Aggregatilinea sp. TaxID=2806333 RepID=UPI002C707DC3|nr:hypothetical protein [Aggregatilinea sp.]HML22110.1 hypothetical protein [Aggregatilinea sp.]
MAKTRYPWLQMAALAGELVRELEPVCSRLSVAGSLRRGQDRIGDIELVAIADGTLLDEQCNEWLAHGIIEQRRKSTGSLLAWGSRYKAFVYDGIPVDLFITSAPQWGLIYQIRTGPGSSDQPRWPGGANQMLMTPHSRGGLLPDHDHDTLRVEGGWMWRGDRRLDTPEELDVYRLLGIPLIAPFFRDIPNYTRVRKEGSALVEHLREQQFHVGMARDTFWPVIGWCTPGMIYFPSGDYYLPYNNTALIRLADRLRRDEQIEVGVSENVLV